MREPLARSLRRLLLGACAALAATAAGAQPPDWGTLRPGPHAVGYRLVYLTDPTRTATPHPDDSAALAAARRAGLSPDATPARMLPLRIWYPAVARAGGTRRAALRLADYVTTRPDGGVAPREAEGLRERTLDLRRYAAGYYARAAGLSIAPADTTALVARLDALPALAVRAAPAARGRFPVVVFAGGAYHSVDENVVLWEYLASRGYVVAAFPSLGIGVPNLPTTPAGLETMARDVELSVAYAAALPSADPTRVAAAGFSFGGAAALVAAARNARVGAVFGLDASFVARRFAATVLGAPLFAPARLRAPVLELHRADTTVTFAVLDTLARVPRYSLELRGVDHIDFNSYAVLLRPVLRAWRAERDAGAAARDSALALKATAYEGMVRAAERFLDRTIGAGRAAGSAAGSATVPALGALLAPASLWDAPAAGVVTLRTAPPGAALAPRP